MMAENCVYGSWRNADALLYRAWTLADRKINSRGKARLAGGGAEKIQLPYGLNLTEFTFGNEAWCALDAPGPNEALAHAQHALLASDACILCVSSAPEEAVLAAPYLRVIEASETPCILFVNRMDEPRGRLRDVIAALQDYANHTLLLRQIPIREGDRIIGSCDLISERAWRYREARLRR